MTEIITRFPPEPNGYLHLGHLKAMSFDFDLHHQGKCILRLDDTNPEAEKQEYVDSIIEDVKWLGFNPWKITYTSDYFQQLYDFAIELIKKDKAYVDFSNTELIKEERHKGIESKYRNYPTDFHLAEFNNMKNGIYKESEAVLRLKIDMQNLNHTLRDPIAYRIKFTPHFRTGSSWVIYPSYDYSHGLVDALEYITYSYCTMEFYVRREQYYWPVIQLGLIPAEVHEFGRLNVDNNVLSKRKIIKLIEDKYVDSFDDPRLLTVKGLRRRGFTPDILKKIISTCVTKIMQRSDMTMSQGFIQHCLREVLDVTAKRAFAVLDPIHININDLTTDKLCQHPNHPINKELGDHITLLSSDIYIESSDFKEIDEKNYYRLAPGKTVRLKYADFIQYESHKKLDDLSGTSPIKINTSNIIPPNPKKIKGVIHWVSHKGAVPAKFELFNQLIVDDKYNPESKIIMNGYIENFVAEHLEEIFQFERLGYFKFDRMENDVPIFIRVIELVDKYNM
jgi:glutaminyl-tRNA synthetase